ncbi:NAD(P)-dependent oxidoreductase [Phyllobacterium endophyticum]|uniref:NAD(P)-dependent oxidoreductase n=1 Tax=Phyllobacterium endophyticum TaxID=1149773 RepID=UPI0011CB3DCA|nr:NAD(P)-dependent oxidoreductase [Phyllobacterium endophyticum]TXR47494.1 NAD(P)-dependent oxidoreductase [Phyllobacterium endophyticum]
MNKAIAFIGLGQMGGNMAARLVEFGFTVSGYDLNPAARQNLVDAGGQAVGSIEQAVAGHDIVMTSLPDPSAVLATYLGKEGIVELATPGCLLIDLSTIDPDTMRHVGTKAKELKLRVVDCPVSGSPKDSRAGTLTIMMGGDEEDVRLAEPYLEALSTTRLFTGDVGSAKVVKIVNNMMAMGNVLIASEAFALGVKAGVAPQLLYDVLSVSGGRSHHFVNRFKNALQGNFDPGFKIELGEKDLALGIGLGEMLNQPTPAASIVRQLFSQALGEGLRGRDIVALLQMYQNWSSDTPNSIGETRQ